MGGAFCRRIPCAALVVAVLLALGTSCAPFVGEADLGSKSLTEAAEPVKGPTTLVARGFRSTSVQGCLSFRHSTARCKGGKPQSWKLPTSQVTMPSARMNKSRSKREWT